MIFHAQPLAGLFLLELKPIKDDRGFFARSWCRREGESQGIECDFVQSNISYNKAAHTLRGLHFQKAPYEEAKLVSCIQGSIYDVVVDIRPDSRTFGQWLGFELSQTNLLALYIPAGFAHGFQTLEDESTVHYQMSEYFMAASQGGLLWNDPALAISWPHAAKAILSDRDRLHPGLEQFASKSR